MRDGEFLVLRYIKRNTRDNTKPAILFLLYQHFIIRIILISWSPRLDIAILTGRVHHMLLVKEAERSHNLVAVSARKTDAVFPIQSPALSTWVLGEEDKLECLLTEPR